MKPTNTYDGVYKDFSEVDGVTPYNNEENLASMDGFCREYLKTIFSHKSMDSNFTDPTGRTQYTDHLGMLASCIIKEKNSVNILDIGGGFGQSFLELCAMIGDNYKKVNYCCLDLNDTIDYVTRDSGDRANYSLGTPIEDRLRFVSDIPIKDGPNNDFDIVFVSAALHYFSNKYEVLGEIIDKLSPKHILILRTTVVLETESFVSAQQNLFPLRIPMWFMNHDEILNFLKARDYNLDFKSSIYMEGRPIAENLPQQCHSSRLAYYLFSRQRTWSEKIKALIGALSR